MQQLRGAPYSRPQAYFVERKRQKQRLGVIPYGDTPAAQPGFAYVTGSDGSYLTGASGAYILTSAS